MNMDSFTTLPSPFGVFILAADIQGICAIHLPTSIKSIPFPPECQVPLDAHPLLAEAGRQLLAYVEGRLTVFDLPLSLNGTPFQKQVWQELLAIPYGHTQTYGELAQRIGGRGKARAVGGAAHANPVAIVIPCHRLIGAGGKLTGFGGGLPMKQTLLDLERNSLRETK
ncbi:MAG: methylated-DNA--[protein]-cysteine S-methyltransferase [Desulfobulbus sp.]